MSDRIRYRRLFINPLFLALSAALPLAGHAAQQAEQAGSDSNAAQLEDLQRGDRHGARHDQARNGHERGGDARHQSDGDRRSDRRDGDRDVARSGREEGDRDGGDHQTDGEHASSHRGYEEDRGYRRHRSDAHDLPTISVRHKRERDQGYKADTATVGSKTPTDLRETPQSVSIITQQRIQDQNLRTTADLLAQVPSVSNASSPEGFVMIRGFSGMTLVDGVPVGGLVGRTHADLSVFERVEVLKGPAGLFSGAGSPGGAINYVFKKPTRELSGEVSLGAGSDNVRTGGIDVSTPLTQGGRLRARAVAFRDKRDEFVDVDKRDRKSTYVVFAYDLTPDTVASVGYYRQKNRAVQGFRTGLPTYDDGGLLWDVDRRTSLTQDWAKWKFKADWLLADIEHRFSNDWTAKIAYREGESEHPSWYPQPGASFEDSACGDDFYFAGVQRGVPGGSSQCFHAEFYNDVNTRKSLDAFVSGSFEAFGRRHELVVGANAERNSFLRFPFYAPHGSYDFLVDVFNPNPHVIDEPPRPEVIEAEGGPSRVRNHGAYLRATLQLNDWLKLPVGGRLTWVSSSDGDSDADRESTPYAGLVAELPNDWTVYASYTDIFNASSYNRAYSETDPNGVPLPYESGTQYEAGIKKSWLDDRVLATAAVYELTLDNVAREDRDHPGFSIANGQQTTRGFEFDLNGRLLPGWDLGFGYAYMSAKYSKHDYAQGQFVENTPRHAASLYTNYHFGGGRLDGLSIGGGLRYSGSIQGDPLAPWSAGPVRVRAPGYTTVGLRADYRFTRNLQLAVNIDNVFDKKYWQALGAVDGANYYGAPRTFMANLRLDF